MNRAQEEQNRPLLGNPFSRKGSNLSPELHALLNTFEDTLSTRINDLMQAGNEDVLSLSWMTSAMESLCGAHTDLKALITDLELPARDWPAKLIDVYLANSMKLLNICIAFNHEISRLKQSHIHLLCAFENLNEDSLVRARANLDEWKRLIGVKNPRLDDCFYAMDSLGQMLDVPKVKWSGKGEVLMQAMYGVKEMTLLVSGVLAAAFSGSGQKRLIDRNVPKTCLWAEAFRDAQTFVNAEIKSLYSVGRVKVNELEAIDAGFEKLYPILQNEAVGRVEARKLKKATCDLKKYAENFSKGLDLLEKEVNGFFKIVVSGRNALLSGLRVGGDGSD